MAVFISFNVFEKIWVYLKALISPHQSTKIDAAHVRRLIYGFESQESRGICHELRPAHEYVDTASTVCGIGPEKNYYKDC